MKLLCLLGHKWNYCKCSRCGELRDENHKWDYCKCEICGKARDENHNWDGCKCKKCGKIRVDGVTDQNSLKSVVLDQRIDKSLRLQALNKITDQKVLCEIAVTYRGTHFVSAFEEQILIYTLRKITDQEMIKKTIRESPCVANEYVLKYSQISQETLMYLIEWGNIGMLYDLPDYFTDEKLIAQALIKSYGSTRDNSYDFSGIAKRLIWKMDSIELLEKIADESEIKWVASFAREQIEYRNRKK